jgi:hypothetical protein
MQFNVLKLKVCNNLRSAAMSHNDEGFFLSEKSSKARLREAENARKNRAEIVKAFEMGTDYGWRRTRPHPWFESVR